MFRYPLTACIAALLLFMVVQPCARGQAPHSARLPLATDLGEEAYEVPREVFRSEAGGGHKSYLVILGDVAFSSPQLLGDTARQAGISCATCHVNGASNPRLYIPGLSTRPGNIDTTGHFFNPAADDGVLNPLTIPSLRGAHMLAPYGHDGRTLSLRDFVRNVIVTEFAGAEPAAGILDALVSYIEDIDFVPNAHLQSGGRLSAANTPAARRGEKLFRRPFPHDPALSCAACHQPDEAFLDHRQHDVGSGGHFKTPTLLNANFNAPYFHDGRYDRYAQVIAHFDGMFGLRLSSREQRDLVAYLQAVGDGDQGLQPDMIATRVRELDDFSTALDTALPAHDAGAARLILDTLDSELRDLTEKFPERKDPTVHGGDQERARARAALKSQVLLLRAVELAVEDGRFEDARARLGDYRATRAAGLIAMHAAGPWSLFARTVHDEHYATVRRYFEVGTQPTAAR